MKNTLLKLTLLTIIIIISCRNNISSENNSADIENFDYVLYDGLNISDLASISGALKDNYSRILSDLQVDEMPKITIKIWSDYSSFEQAMFDDLGQLYAGATGYIFGPTEIRVFKNNNAEMIAVHEFVHVVSMQVNPTIPNNPRWLWEAIACYECGDLIDPNTIPYLIQGEYPTIAELNVDYYDSNHNIYQVGYILYEYILDTWGQELAIELIEQNGRINSVLGITTTAFELGWYNFIENNYLNN